MKAIGYAIFGGSALLAEVYASIHGASFWTCVFPLCVAFMSWAGLLFSEGK
jgi:hypothetical protein